MSAVTPPVHPVRFRVLIDDAVRLARAHFRAVFPAVGVPLAVVTALFVVAQSLWMTTLAPAAGQIDPAGMFTAMGSMMLGLLVLVAVKGLGYAAMMAAMTDAAAGRAPAMPSAWRFALTPRVLGTLLLSFFLTCLAMIFCFFPAVYVGLLLALVTPVMREEGTAGWQAISRSASLVRHNPHRRFVDAPIVKVFLIFLIGTVISYAVSALVQLPFAIAQQAIVWGSVIGDAEAADPTSVMAGLVWLQAPGALLGGLAEAAVMVYTTGAVSLFYLDLRRRREGEDLEQAIDALEAAAERA